MAGSSNESTIQVTLLCSKANGRVLYLEAGKDFVDILLSFLTLPVGTVIKLLSGGRNHASMGGISNIFESVKKLDESVLHVHKDTLTNPRPATGFRPATNLLRIAAEPEHTTASSLYLCSYCYSYVSASQYQKCSCGHSMTKSVHLLQPEAAESPAKKKGYLKKSLTYIVTDSLDIMLSSTIKSIEILNKLKVEKMSDLQSITVSITPPQILQLLRSSLQSTTALTEVFKNAR